VGTLQRWWRTLWPSSHTRPEESAPHRSPGGQGSGSDGDDIDAAARGAPVRRHYMASPAADDPLRETHLGAVLQALSTGETLDRAELGRRVGAADWGPGRLDTVVDHGLATGVLRPDGTGVRARYTD
jgi:hypothetical protein